MASCGRLTGVSVNVDGYEPQNEYCARPARIGGLCVRHYCRSLLFRSGLMRARYLLRMRWLTLRARYTSYHPGAR